MSRFLYAKFMQINATLATSFVSTFMTSYIHNAMNLSCWRKRRFWGNKKNLGKIFQSGTTVSTFRKLFIVSFIGEIYCKQRKKKKRKKNKQKNKYRLKQRSLPMTNLCTTAPHPGCWGCSLAWAGVQQELWQQSLPLRKLPRALTHHHKHLWHIKLCISELGEQCPLSD